MRPGHKNANIMKTIREEFVYIASVSNSKLFATKRISRLNNYEFQKVATKNYCYDIYAKESDKDDIQEILK